MSSLNFLFSWVLMLPDKVCVWGYIFVSHTYDSLWFRCLTDVFTASQNMFISVTFFFKDTLLNTFILHMLHITSCLCVCVWVREITQENICQTAAVSHPHLMYTSLCKHTACSHLSSMQNKSHHQQHHDQSSEFNKERTVLSKSSRKWVGINIQMLFFLPVCLLHARLLSGSYKPKQMSVMW